MSTLNRLEYNQIYENSKPYNYINDAYIIMLNVPSMILITSLLIVLRRNKWSKMSIDTKLASLLVVFDFLGGLVCLTSAITNIFNIGQGLSNPIYCNLDAIGIFICFSMSIYTIGVLGLERCLAIVFKKHLSSKLYYSILIAEFSATIIMTIASLFTNGFYIMPIGEYCLYDYSSPGGLAASILLFLLGGASLTTVLVGYGLICWFRRSQSQKAQLELGLDPVKVKREVNRTIFKSLIIMIASLTTNGPYVIIQIVSWIDPNMLTPLADMLSVIFITSSSFVNSLILLNMKPELFKSLKKLWGFKSE